MELDDFKAAWQVLDSRLAELTVLKLEALRERKLDKVRSKLRPLAWSQTIQILAAIVLVVGSAGFWTQHRGQLHLLAAGMVMHVYGIALIISAARTLNLIRTIDYASPVLAIQQQLARLRKWYVHSGLVVGLAWWLLWIPFMMMAFMILFGADLYANAPSVIWIGTAIGVAGLLATWLFYRWAHQPGRLRIARFIDESTAGRSIVMAQAVVDEVARFERE